MRHVHWFPRLILAMIFIPHGIGKIINVMSFANKFDLSVAVSLTTGAVELLGIAAILLGGFTRTKYSPELTVLGIIPIIVVQLGAIIMVHWPRWFYYVNPPGMEYNFVILGLCAMLAYMSVVRR